MVFPVHATLLPSVARSLSRFFSVHATNSRSADCQPRSYEVMAAGRSAERSAAWWRIGFFPLSSSASSLSRVSLRRSRRLLSLCPSPRELMRGCRLDADNAGGVSFVQSSMILLRSLSLLSSPGVSLRAPSPRALCPSPISSPPLAVSLGWQRTPRALARSPVSLVSLVSLAFFVPPTVRSPRKKNSSPRRSASPSGLGSPLFSLLLS